MSTPPHHRHWPPGVPFTIEVPDESLWDGLARRATATPDEPGLFFLGSAFTWGALARDARHLAGALQRLGLGAGDRVLLFSQNCPQFVVAFHAVLAAGGVVVPVNPMNKADELEHYLRDTGARHAIASSDIAAELGRATAACPGLAHLVVFDLADALPTHTTGDDWPATWRAWLPQRHPLPAAGAAAVHVWSALLARAIEPALVPRRGDDLALLPYTSGTTGHAKGCMHTHATLLHNALGSVRWQDMRPCDTHLIVAPMFHITGLVVGLLAGLHSGGRLVVLPRWDRRVAARAIGEHRVTHWANIPTMVIDLLSGDDLDQYQLGSLRYIGGGGASMPDAVGERLQAQFGLRYVEGYGLTETAAPTHCNPMHAPRLRCLGIPFIGTSALVVDPDTLAPLPDGQAGEIVVRGPQLFKGYWANERATAAAFVEIDGQRWFRTGDLGTRDADGYYTIADRLKRMINASGFKVWPAEVESLLLRHPAIKEACVIAMRDAYRGESPKALVVLHDAQRGRVTPEAIVAWAREHMAAYKVPREVALVDELPRTASGKVLWRRAQAAQDALEVSR
ncbi:AMP-binding protein [Ideonella sp. 4Y11]|uniref:AMP-binding protein n=1 Tax=Ideonella aquatica TaxID=2824119 RepID=A0A940YKS8_9BURK|nr:long-chain-fatty-acid--CoA ligase [Ideonella aquatica]MBQ0959811.1 AMP-binding protein [Ideonella aquatica]